MYTITAEHGLVRWILHEQTPVGFTRPEGFAVNVSNGHAFTSDQASGRLEVHSFNELLGIADSPGHALLIFARHDAGKEPGDLRQHLRAKCAQRARQRKASRKAK